MNSSHSFNPGLHRLQHTACLLMKAAVFVHPLTPPACRVLGAEGLCTRTSSPRSSGPLIRARVFSGAPLFFHHSA